MSDAVAAVLDDLTRIAGVQAAMVVDAEAGVPVLSQLTPGVPETALAALSGVLFSRTAEASRTAELGGLELVELSAAGGHLLVASAGALLVVALAEPDAALGMVRIQAKKAAGRLRDET